MKHTCSTQLHVPFPPRRSPRPPSASYAHGPYRSTAPTRPYTSPESTGRQKTRSDPRRRGLDLRVASSRPRANQTAPRGSPDPQRPARPLDRGRPVCEPRAAAHSLTERRRPSCLTSSTSVPLRGERPREVARAGGRGGPLRCSPPRARHASSPLGAHAPICDASSLESS